MCVCVCQNGFFFIWYDMEMFRAPRVVKLYDKQEPFFLFRVCVFVCQNGCFFIWYEIGLLRALKGEFLEWENFSEFHEWEPHSCMYIYIYIYICEIPNFWHDAEHDDDGASAWQSYFREILKRQFGTECTMEGEYRADVARIFEMIQKEGHILDFVFVGYFSKVTARYSMYSLKRI